MKSFVRTSTVQSIALQLILVSVKVKCECIEEDCTGQAIRVVNPSSGECVTCYPCPPCPDGQTPSVSCPSTVPQGTHIHCVPIVPGPSSVSVSRASAYTKDVIFTLLASPSVTSLYASPTGTKQITAVAVSSHQYDHPTFIPATILKNYTDSNSLIVDTVFKTKKTKRLLYPENDSKVGGGHTVLYLSCGVTLVLVFLGICYRLRKSIKALLQCPISNEPTPSAPSSLTTGAPHAHYRDPFAVHLFPENNSAFFVRQIPKEDHQENMLQESYNHLFHHNQTMLPDESIPSSLDDAHAEDHQQSAISEGATGSDVARSLKDLTSEILPDQPSRPSIKDSKPVTVLPIFTPSVKINLIQTPGASHPIFTFDSWHQNASDVDQQRLAKQWVTLSQAEKYSTKMHEVPFHLCHKVYLELDIIRVDGKDVREFASKQNITVKECARLQQAAKIQNTTTTSVILDQKPSVTVGDFVDIMKEMGRQDIIDLISNEW